MREVDIVDAEERFLEVMEDDDDEPQASDGLAETRGG